MSIIAPLYINHKRRYIDNAFFILICYNQSGSHCKIKTLIKRIILLKVINNLTKRLNRTNFHINDRLREL